MCGLKVCIGESKSMKWNELVKSQILLSSLIRKNSLALLGMKGESWIGWKDLKVHSPASSSSIYDQEIWPCLLFQIALKEHFYVSLPDWIQLWWWLNKSYTSSLTFWSFGNACSFPKHHYSNVLQETFRLAQWAGGCPLNWMTLHSLMHENYNDDLTFQVLSHEIWGKDLLCPGVPFNQWPYVYWWWS